MKFVVILGDGMPDHPLKELGGKTPLEYAHIPNMDELAALGTAGSVKTIPEHLPAGSDVANLSVLGYNPDQYYTGRSPIEAVAMGVELGEEDVAFRCNLVTLSEEDTYGERTMVDYSAEEISTPEGAELMKEVSSRLGGDTFLFYTGISYRNLMVWRGGPLKLELTPPHDIADRRITFYLPQGAGSQPLLSFMEKSSTFLPQHPVNLNRKKKGLRAANSIWLWGQGKKPHLDSFKDKYGLEGSVISAVDLVKGLGLLAGLEVAFVPGATGTVHTNYRGKAQKALEELASGKDFVFIHVEAPDEAGHQGDLQNKIKAIEEIDRQVVGEILQGLENYPDYRLMVMADHPTPLPLKTHTRDAVPFVITGNKEKTRSQGRTFSEKQLAAADLYFAEGYRLMDYFIRES